MRARETARYWDGVAWIAQNDEPELLDVRQVSEMVPVVMLADLTRRDPAEVARHIVLLRYRLLGQ